MQIGSNISRVLRPVFLLVFTFSITAVQSQINKPNTAVTQAPTASPALVAPVPANYPSSIVLNYVRSWDMTAPVTDQATIFSNLPNTAVKQTTSYVDGLGRPLQTVLRQATPGGSPMDMVSPVIYDAFGREQYKYMPYVAGTSDGNFKLDAFTAQKTFLQTQYNGEQVFYSKTVFEASPLDRPVKSYAPGNSWAGNNRGVEQQYLFNTLTNDVKIWSIGNDAANFDNNIPLVGTVAYGDGQLYQTKTIDEAGNAVIEFKDKDGQVILKKVQIDNSMAADYSGYDGFLCTYYVYDDLGMLRCVMPPKAVEWLNEHNWDLSALNGTTVLDELCFRYEYDTRGRMIAKKVPGAGWVYMVYDKRDRLVFTQDANMRARSQWMYTLYDALNRPVQTGIMDAYTDTWTHLQDHVNGIDPMINFTSTIPGKLPSTISETLYISEVEPGRSTYQASEAVELAEGVFFIDGTTVEIIPANNQTFNSVQDVSDPFPSAITNIPLTLSYYDNYDWTTKNYLTTYNSQAQAPAGSGIFPVLLPASQNNEVKSLPIGFRVRIIASTDASAMANAPWLETANFYDDKNRLVQVQADNYKGGEDVAITCYDFTGKTLSNYTVHNNASGNVSNLRVLTTMQYDHAGRLLKTTKRINDDAATERTIAENDYDALGQLKHKKIGQQRYVDGNLSTEPLENQAYSYNIRGWLKGINWEGYGSTGGTYGNIMLLEAKRFAMDLSYDWGYDKNQYNGNIAGMRWITIGDREERSYGFGYDPANRLLKGDFTQKKGTVWDNSAGVDFSMKMGSGENDGTAYDANGNIKAMSQIGVKLNTSGTIDNLTYNYTAGEISNKLLSVTEDASIGTIDNKLGDFTDKNHTLDDYSYDANGNLVLDKNKSISSIEYNYLNLPYKITVDGKGSITYIYDATGNKLEKLTEEPVASAKKYTTYLGGYVYENNVLKFFAHEEGRIRKATQNPGKNECIAIASQAYVFDYFIKDHLGNVRLVLTDEWKRDDYPAATMETAAVSTEKAVYSKIEETQSELPSNYPSSSSVIQPNAGAARLNGYEQNRKVGPGIMLKVMAGDRLNIKCDMWYHMNTSETPGNPLSPLADILLNLVAATPGAAGGHISATQLGSGSVFGPAVQSLLDNQPTPIDKPKASLNWIFLDEHLQPAAGNGYEPVGDNDEYKQTVKSCDYGIEVQQNGYVYIYTSNESNINVFFDNLQVSHIRGPLLEETHYYPFGLTMAGISSKAINTTPNKENTFQGQRFDDELGLDWIQFKWRNHDPQIGRFIEIDPLADKYVYNSTYAFSENKVTNDIELEGLESISAFMSTLLHSAGLSENTDSKTFAIQTASTLTKPETYENAVLGMGPVLGAVTIGLFTGGFGSNLFYSTSTSTELTAAEGVPMVSLEARAKEIHSALPIKTQGFNTTAVASATTAEGESTTLVASNELNLRTPQLKALRPGEVAVTGVGHAETTILDHAKANGMTVNAIAASRPICQPCAVAIQNAGAVPASPLKIIKTPAAVADATFLKVSVPPPAH